MPQLSPLQVKPFETTAAPPGGLSGPPSKWNGASLAGLELTQPVPWQPPRWWDTLIASQLDYMPAAASPSGAAAMLARLETTQIDPRLEPMRQRVLWLLREPHPLNNKPAAVASTSLQCLWAIAEDDDHCVLHISWVALALVRWVNRRARLLCWLL